LTDPTDLCVFVVLIATILVAGRAFFGCVTDSPANRPLFTGFVSFAEVTTLANFWNAPSCNTLEVFTTLPYFAVYVVSTLYFCTHPLLATLACWTIFVSFTGTGLFFALSMLADLVGFAGRIALGRLTGTRRTGFLDFAIIAGFAGGHGGTASSINITTLSLQTISILCTNLCGGRTSPGYRK
jgi:hypothetical protein